MRSVRMSSGVRWAAASGCCSRQRVRPASAAALSGDWATVIRGWADFRGARSFFSFGESVGDSVLIACLRKRLFPKPSPIWSEKALALLGCTRLGSDSPLAK